MSRPERDTLSKEAYCPICETSFTANRQVCAECNGPLVILEQAEDTLVGEDLDGRYRLKEKLGSGGMGAVYLAEQLAIERDVVVKVIRPDLSNDIFAAKRFLREAKMASKLSHPHTVSVFEFGQTSSGLLFIAMELLRGETLHELLDEEAPLDPTRACEIVLQILDGLAAAHACDIVHRDLKPANIVILDDPPGQDFVKILDFGLAKSLAGHNTATEAGMMMGTPAYMAPEMIFGGDVDLRSDLYAAGIILYELLCGALPFENSEIKELLVAQVYNPAPPLGPEVPQPIAQVVAQLLKKEPAERFTTAMEARKALASALAIADATTIRGVAVSDAVHVARREPGARAKLPPPVRAQEPTTKRTHAAKRAHAAPTAHMGRDDLQARHPPRRRRQAIVFAAAGLSVAVVALLIAFSGGDVKAPVPQTEEAPKKASQKAGATSSDEPMVRSLVIDAGGQKAASPVATDSPPPKKDAGTPNGTSGKKLREKQREKLRKKEKEKLREKQREKLREKQREKLREKEKEKLREKEKEKPKLPF